MIARALLAAAIAFVSGGAANAPNAATLDSGAISGLGVRNIGSAEMSGRISAIAGRHEKDGKITLFVGAASGGVWKSTDGATSFEPVFDKEPVQSIGAIALDPTNAQTVWVGTGESWTRNSVSVGDGIYKSTDGGENWTNMGLPNSERIARIIVSPVNGNVVYACVPGKLWSDSADRGLYRTTDGGAHWSLVLPGSNLSTGCSSVTLDPSNPKILFAGLWDFRRKGWTFRSGGDGPNARSGSALFRSVDGGRSWTKLAAAHAGLPAAPWGRIEVTIAPSNPQRVYAFIESPNSALYVSNDGGKSWEQRDRSQRMVWRPFYFARLVVDPSNAQRVFKPNLRLIVSDDGGRSFADSGGGSHGDWHDLWIDPQNSKYIAGGDDGGLWLSYDGGTKWWKGANLPISQFYHVSVDDKDPYQVYGGLQDNSSWVGDSAYPGGISNERWENLYGGDGFWSFTDPKDPNFTYTEAQGGSIGRVNRKTLETRDIQPRAGYGEKLRYNWNTPIALSPNQPGTIYIGAQFLFRSSDQGNSWQRISPDLTTNDPAKQQQEKSGGITVDNSAAETHTTIYSISESPKNGKVLWVGTDDGNVQVTRDGGTTWTNVVANVPGLPAASWVSWVEASRYDAATAYATFDRHTFGDIGTYLYRTTDYGRTWTPLVTPQTVGVRGYAHVIREDTVDPNLLFLGTEFGLWTSVDGGQSWAAFKPDNFPAVAVRDIAIQPRDNDLVIATHGRGIWIVDDLTPLRNLTPQTTTAEATLLPGRPVQQRIEANGGWPDGDASYSGDNPADGAVISYYLKSRAVIGKLTLDILDASGHVVDSIPAGKRKGINRVVWSMRTKPPLVPPAAQLAGSAALGPRFLPGTYTVRLTRAGTALSMPLTIELDRRATFSVADRRAQFDAANRVKALFARMTVLVGHIAALRSQAGADAAKLAPGDPLRTALAGFADKANELRKLVVATTEGGAITGEERLRENAADVYGAIVQTEGAPTTYALARIAVLDRELADVEASYTTLTTTTLPPLNDRLKAKSLPALAVAANVPETVVAHGGELRALFSGIVGSRYRGAPLAGGERAGDER